MPRIMQAAAEMELSEDALAQLSDDMQQQAAVTVLLELRLVQDALKLQARLLPARYAVAWLCQCARDQSLGDDDKLGASLAEKWLRDPSESNRRVAYDFAFNNGFKSLGAWLAVAAGWSGGSLAPASQEEKVPPPEHLTAVAVVAAINQLAALDPERIEARQLEFVDQAARIFGSGELA